MNKKLPKLVILIISTCFISACAYGTSADFNIESAEETAESLAAVLEYDKPVLETMTGTDFSGQHMVFDRYNLTSSTYVSPSDEGELKNIKALHIHTYQVIDILEWLGFDENDDIIQSVEAYHLELILAERPFLPQLIDWSTSPNPPIIELDDDNCYQINYKDNCLLTIAFEPVSYLNKFSWSVILYNLQHDQPLGLLGR